MHRLMLIFRPIYYCTYIYTVREVLFESGFHVLFENEDIPNLIVCLFGVKMAVKSIASIKAVALLRHCPSRFSFLFYLDPSIFIM